MIMFVGGVRQEAESQQREEETTAADWSLRAVLMRESDAARALCVAGFPRDVSVSARDYRVLDVGSALVGG